MSLALTPPSSALTRGLAANAVVKIFARPGPQSRSYNAPAVPQVAVLIPDAESLEIAGNTRDIIVRKQGGGLQHISEFNPAFDPLHFVMMRMS